MTSEDIRIEPVGVSEGHECEYRESLSLQHCDVVDVCEEREECRMKWCCPFLVFEEMTGLCLSAD